MDLTFQNISSVQSSSQPTLPTIASATTIAVTHKMTFLTGTVQLATIIPPVTGFHEIVLVFTNATPGAFVTTGNIQAALQPIQNLPVFLFYDPVSAKYWGFPGTLT